ncbi:MAG: GtrA family protein [Muribaculaceae bacterium]|nr:GtrA family protein [Muribaculaceae bacterium]
METQSETQVSDSLQPHEGNKIKALGTKLLKSKSLVPTFLRSAVSSQASGWVDLGVGFVMFYWIFNQHLLWLATGIGVVAGGIVNCIICYKFTFRAENCPWKAVVVKYALVWVGNLILNSEGTELLYILFNKMTLLEQMGFKPAGYYMTARVVMSLLVSWFWNFLLQRNFVYQPSRFDPYAVRFMTRFLNFFKIKHSDD